jgi:hypothetical protein
MFASETDFCMTSHSQAHSDFVMKHGFISQGDRPFVEVFENKDKTVDFCENT